MPGNTLPIPGRRTPLVDRFRNVTDYWWPWMDAMLKNMRLTQESVETLETSVTETIDQINGKWSLTVNVDNRIVGSITIDGSSSTPTVAILADKFEIVHPSDNNDTIQAFVTGIVDGVPTVGINGALVVDGTIIAEALDVVTLSAITADVGTLTAGVIQSADGAVVLDLDNGIFSITT